jgi:hypothetical protein
MKKGQNHFNSKDSGKQTCAKRQDVVADVSVQAVKKALPSHKW